MSSPAPGSNSLAPQITTISQPAQDIAVFDLYTTPAGVVTTLDSLAFAVDMLAGFEPSAQTGNVIILEALDPFGNVAYRHAIACPQVE